MLSLYLFLIFKMLKPKAYKLLFVFVVVGLLFQGCGSLQKCRYSRGWNWSFERNLKEEVKPLKIKTVTKRKAINHDALLKIEDTTLDLVTLKDTSKKIAVLEDPNINTIIYNKDQFSQPTVSNNKAFIIPQSKKDGELSVKVLQNDEWGIAAFILTVLAGILLLIVYAYSLFLFDTLGGIALTLLYIGRIFLIVRIFKFRKGKKQFYKNKGFGNIAILLTLIASYIIGYFMFLGFLDIIF